MKWFFTLNQTCSFFDQYSEMAKVAVLSARKHTDLEPVLLFDGVSEEFINWMQSHQVVVIQMESSLSKALTKIAPDRVDVGRGAFLRVDIPWVMDRLGWNDPFVLYTDCDVLFIKPLDLSNILPTYFAVAAEVDIEDNLNMNTGVMVMNIENLQRTYQGFQRFVTKYLNHFAYLDYDQTAYRCYYHMEWQTLPPQYNWKPYWGENPEAVIVHFHGPKPTEKEAAQQETLVPIRQNLVCEPFFRWVKFWDTYAQEAYQANSNEEEIKPTMRISLGEASEQIIADNRLQSKETQKEAQLDYLYNLAIQQSTYRQYCEDNAVCDWRAVKGAFTLWVMFHTEDYEAQLAFSGFFQFLEQLDNEYAYLIFAYRLKPTDLQIIKRLGVNLIRRKYFADARIIYETLAQQAPNDVDVILGLAKVYTELKQYPKALECLERAYASNPHDHEIQLGLEVVRHKIQIEY